MLPFEVARGLKHCLSFGIRIRVTGTSPNDGLSEFEMLARGLRLGTWKAPRGDHKGLWKLWSESQELMLRLNPKTLWLPRNPKPLNPK